MSHTKHGWRLAWNRQAAPLQDVSPTLQDVLPLSPGAAAVINYFYESMPESIELRRMERCERRWVRSVQTFSTLPDIHGIVMSTGKVVRQVEHR